MVAIVSHLGPFSAVTLVVLTFVGAAVAVWAALHRWCRWLLLDKDNIGAGQIFGSAIGTMFTLVFALVTIAIWENYDRVAGAVGDEANSIHNIYRYLDDYPPALREPTQGLIQSYLKRVIVHEWPLLATGDEDPEAQRMVIEINARLVAYRPATPAENPLHQELLAQVSAYRALRHGRLQASKPYVDTSMWIALTVGSLTLMVYCGAWQLGDRRQHLIMIAALGTSLGIVCFLLLAYSHPFTGPEAIRPAPFKALLDRSWR